MKRYELAIGWPHGAWTEYTVDADTEAEAHEQAMEAHEPAEISFVVTLFVSDLGRG